MVLEPKHVLQKVLGAVWRAGTIVPTKVPCTSPHTRPSSNHTLATITTSIHTLAIHNTSMAGTTPKGTAKRPKPHTGTGPSNKPKAGKPQPLTHLEDKIIIRSTWRQKPPASQGPDTTTNKPKAEKPQALAESLEAGKPQDLAESLVAESLDTKPEEPDLVTRQKPKQEPSKAPASLVSSHRAQGPGQLR